MAYRYIQIHDLSEAQHDEKVYAVYLNPTFNRSGRPDSEQILAAYEDAKTEKCKLVVWRYDEDETFYEAIDEDGRLREKHTAPSVNTSKDQPDTRTRRFASIRAEIEELARFHAIEVPVRYGDGEERTEKMISLNELSVILSEMGEN